MLKIALGCDHGDLELKEDIFRYLKAEGYEVVDAGTSSQESCHYPVFGAAVGELVATRQCDFGIVVCTTGEGICMAVNKVKGARCGIGYNNDVARLMRQHNDANVISFGAKYTTAEEAFERIDIFLHTEFEGGRHQVRVDMLSEIESR